MFAPKSRLLSSFAVASITLSLALSGCSSTPEPEPPVITVQVTPTPQIVTVKYRVTGIKGKVGGSYINSKGAAVEIDGPAPGGIWEKTERIPADVMRKKPTEFNADCDSGATITLEIYADGRQIGSQVGVNPGLTVEKH